MRRAAAANRAIEPFLYLLETASADLSSPPIDFLLQREQQSSKSFQISSYNCLCLIGCVHCRCIIINPSAAKEIYWVTLNVGEKENGGRETEMRPAHGHRTHIHIYHLLWVRLVVADSHRNRFKMRIYSLVYQTLTLAFMAAGFQTVKSHPLINQMLEHPHVRPNEKIRIYFYDCVIVLYG
jgi:hypothetical protein